MTFVVREALPNDAVAMGAIHVAAWRSAYTGVMSDAYLDPIAEARHGSFGIGE